MIAGRFSTSRLWNSRLLHVDLGLVTGSVGFTTTLAVLLISLTTFVGVGPLLEGHASAFYTGDDELGNNYVHSDDAALKQGLLSNRMGELELISAVDGNPGRAVDGSTGCPGLSANGRFVVFWSTSDTLAPGGSSEVEDLYVHDRMSGNTELAFKMTPFDTKGNRIHDDLMSSSALFGCPSITDDGNVIVFETLGDLASTDIFVCEDVYLYDRDADQTQMLNKPSSFGAHSPTISRDGRFVVYSDSVLGVVRHDLSTGIREVVVNADEQSNTSGEDATLNMSSSGRYVLYENTREVGNGPTQNDLYVADMQTGQTTNITQLMDKSAHWGSTNGFIAEGNKTVLFAQTNTSIKSPTRVMLADVDTGDIRQLVRDGWPAGISDDGDTVVVRAADQSLSKYASDNYYDLYAVDVPTRALGFITPPGSGTEDRQLSAEAAAFSVDGNVAVYRWGWRLGKFGATPRIYARSIRGTGSLDVEAPRFRHSVNGGSARPLRGIRAACSEPCRVYARLRLQARALPRPLRIRMRRVVFRRPGVGRLMPVARQPVFRLADRLTRRGPAMAILVSIAIDRWGNKSIKRSRFRL